MEDDSCDPLIRIRFNHQFSSLIIIFISFEKLNVLSNFLSELKFKIHVYFQTYLQYTTESMLGLLFACKTLKRHFFVFLRSCWGPHTHNGLIRAPAHRSCREIRTGIAEAPHDLLKPLATFYITSYTGACQRGPLQPNLSHWLIAGLFMYITKHQDNIPGNVGEIL